VCTNTKEVDNHCCRATTSGTTHGVFPLDLVFLHFDYCSCDLSYLSCVFMSELNVINYTICVIITVIETFDFVQM